MKKFLIGLLAIVMLIPAVGHAMTLEEAINTAYLDMLDREPSAAEVAVAYAHYSSFDELKSELNGLAERDEAIINIYQRALKRNPRNDELEALKQFVAPNNLIREQLFTSRERTLAIQDAYMRLIGRMPRASALEFYVVTRSPFEKIKDVLNASDERLLALEKRYVASLGRPPTEAEVNWALDNQVWLGDISSESSHLVAFAGHDQVHFADQLEIILDGSESIAPSTVVEYRWKLVSSPTGRVFSRTVSTPMTKFVFGTSESLPGYATSGRYVFELRIASGGATSEADTFVVEMNEQTETEQKVLDLINKVRADNGKNPLSWNSKLLVASRKYAQYLLSNDWFSHTSKEGATFVDRALNEQYEYQIIGENLGKIQSDLDDLSFSNEILASMVTSWVNSPDHFNNIINADYVDTGVGLILGRTDDQNFPYKLFAVQMFGEILAQ